MTFSRSARRSLFLPAAFLALGAVARAQGTTLFSETFEGPPGPPGMVGAYTETDPLFGGPAPTLWHLEGQCGAFPVGGYSVAASSAPFSSILGTPGGVLVFSSGDDGYSGRLLLPFTFPHFGAPFGFGAIDINRNGFVATFPGGGGGTDYLNDPPGTPSPPNGVIGPWWDDTVHTAGFTLLAVLGSPPNQQIVIEWHDLEHYPGNASGENATSQAVIHANGILEFRYDNASFSTGGDPWDATCGTENFDGTTGKDVTGQGNSNSTFPSTGFVLTPTPPAIPTIPSCMGTKAAAYNLGDVGPYTYNTGGQTTGALESPPVVSTSAASTLALVFDYTKSTENSTTFDQCFVETAPSGSGNWSVANQLTAIVQCSGPAQTEILILPAALSGTSFQHRFRFDSVDGYSNDYTGWYVDNVRVRQLPGGATVLLTENFETGGLGAYVETDSFGSPAATLWHDEATCDGFTPIPTTMGTKAAAYNQGDIGIYTYNNGSQNEGAIESPTIPAPPPGGQVSLAFEYTKETEGGGSLTFDQCFVEANPAGAGWTTLTQIGGLSPCPGSTNASVLVTGLGSGTWQSRFRFNSVDSVLNDYQGWYVDNVSATAQFVNFSTTFGAGCAGAAGCTPSISIGGVPYPGNAGFQVLLSGANPGSTAILVIGLSNSGPPCPLALPFALSSLVPGNGCLLRVCPDILVSGIPVSSGSPCSGSAALTIPIPCGTPPGATAYKQWIVINPAAFPNPNFLSASPGLQIDVL